MCCRVTPCNSSDKLQTQTQDIVKHLFRELLGRQRPAGPQPRCRVCLSLTKQKVDGAVAQECTGTWEQLPPDTNNTWEQQLFRQHQLDSSGHIWVCSLWAKRWCLLPWVGKCWCFQELTQQALKSVQPVWTWLVLLPDWLGFIPPYPRQEPQIYASFAAVADLTEPLETLQR